MMKTKKISKKRISISVVSLLMALLMVCLAGCNKDGKDNSSSGSSGGIVITPDDSSDTSSEDNAPKLEIPTRTDKVKSAKDANKDVVGWLYIPGLSGVDHGVCHDASSYSYDRRDINGKKLGGIGSGKEYWVYGAYYTHLRNTFGDDESAMSTNTVIFGHSDLGITNKNYKDDDPEGPLFSQLFRFRDPSFAEKTPYIYFSTPTKTLVYEVFSVFYNDAKIDGGKSLWYIEPEPGVDYGTLLDTVKERSLYKYDVDVTTSDKILTLSTCTVGFGLQKRGNYRFVIVAKLVSDTSDLRVKNASFTINADAPIPSTFEKTFKDYVANWKPSTEVVAADPGSVIESSAASSSASSASASK